MALADHPAEKTVSLLAISLSHLEQHWKLQLELPLGLEDEKRRPGSQRGIPRWTADRAIDLIRDRFGWDAVGYGSVMLGLSRSVPDRFFSASSRNSPICGLQKKRLRTERRFDRLIGRVRELSRAWCGQDIIRCRANIVIDGAIDYDPSNQNSE